MTRRSRILSLAPALALAVAVAACGGGGGGGDDDEAADDDRETTTTADDDATTTTAAGTGTTAAGEAADPPSGEPGDVGTALGVDRTFTGEGSEQFCADVRALQTSVGGEDSARISEATVTGQLAAMTPPDEIADDWNTMITVQEAIVSAGSASALADVPAEQMEAYGTASAVIAAYLGDVCGLSYSG